MKDQKFGPLPVLLLTLAGGIVGFFLRLRMLAVGYDAQGVQIPGSWPFVALWILSGVVVLGLVLICLGMGNRAGLEENFKAASAPGVCMMLSAAALFICALVQLLDKPDLFTTLVSILGLGGASALAYSGYLRLSGKASGPAGMLVCLYLAAPIPCWGITVLSFWRLWLLWWLPISWPDSPWGRDGGGLPSSAPWRRCFSAAFLWQIPDGPTGSSLPP